MRKRIIWICPDCADTWLDLVAVGAVGAVGNAQRFPRAVGIAIPEPDPGTRPVSQRKHLFLSYCHDNQAEVAKLRDDLIAAGEAVWWDQDILGGQDWKHEIRKAMRDAYAVVFCLSSKTADRITSAIYPEVLDAIAAYREYTPGSIFLIPVRLSDCEIPLIEIDGTRTLDRLQYVDLFPAGYRAAGFGKLLRSLKATPLHPVGAVTGVPRRRGPAVAPSVSA
jgi:hypothetical protein